MIIRSNKGIKKHPVVKQEVEAPKAAIVEEVTETVEKIETPKKAYKVTKKKKPETLLDSLNDLDVLLKSLEESESENN